MTWSTLIPAQTTATATRPQAHWARRAASATKPQRAWTAVSSCAAAEDMTSSRPTSMSAATASFTGAATLSASAAQHSWTSLCVNSTLTDDGQKGDEKGGEELTGRENVTEKKG